MKASAEKPSMPAPLAGMGVGATVLLRIGGSDAAPELRAATVTGVHGDGAANLMVLLDGPADCPVELPGEAFRHSPGIRWCEGVARGTGVGQWRPCGGEG